MSNISFSHSLMCWKMLPAAVEADAGLEKTLWKEEGSRGD